MAYQSEDAFYGVEGDKSKFFYGVLGYKLTPRTTLSLGVSYLKRDYPLHYGLPLYSDGTGLPRDSFVGNERLSTHEDKDIYIDFSHQFSNDWELKAAYNYNETEAESFIARALNPINIDTGLTEMSVAHSLGEADSNSFDINISGPINLFDREHTLVFGYNRSQQSIHQFASKIARSENWDLINNHDFSQYDPVMGMDRRNGTDTVYEQSGLYASARLKLLDPLTLIIGGRWSDYKTKSRTFGTNARPWVTGDNKTSGEFTPYGGLIWDVNDQFSLYASYTDTFIPQAQQDYTGATLESRVGWQAEVGAKAQFFDGKLNASIAAFRLRDTNRPILDPDHVGCGPSGTASCYIASGLVQSQGWELEISGSPAPGWDVMGGYTYTHAKDLENTNPSLVGARFDATNTPRHLFKLWAQYKFGHDALGGKLNGWSIGGGVQISSDRYTDFTRQGGYATALMKLGYQINPNWDATLTVNNLFDRKYYRTVGYSAYGNLYGDPRSAMLTLRAQF